MKKIFTIITTVFFTLASYGQSGQVQGRVYDMYSNEPLPFVNVIVTGTTIGTATDFDGNFLLTGLEAGYITLTASFLGYETAITRDVLISNSKIASVDIAMEESTEKIEEVVVAANPFRKTIESPLSLKNIGLSEIESNPGSNRDISRVIQSFPGVGSTANFRNDIIIRGGGPSESRFYLDGVEIPNLNHFTTQGASGGPVGIINADFIGGVKFYSGAFPADKGNALSGVFEFTQIDGNSDKMKFRGSVGASELSLTADGPIGENTTYILSTRRSYLQFLFDALGLPFLPTFTDYQLKLKSKINKKNEFTLVSIGALDNFALNTGIENPDESQEYILTSIPVNEQWSYAIGGVWKHFGDKSFQTLVLSRNMLNNVAYKHPENDESLPRILDYKSQEIENNLRYTISRRIADYKINYGAGGEYAKYYNSTKQQIYTFGELIDINYESDLMLFKYNAFAQVSKKYFNDKLSASFGLRVDGNSFSSSMSNPFLQSSPRASLSYSLTPMVSINFNTGRYYQLPAYTTLGYRDSLDVLKNKENELKYIAVDHVIGGLEINPSKQLIFTLEGFYKNYNDYPFSLRDSIPLATKGADFGVLGDEEVKSIGKGRAVGAEFMTRVQTSQTNVILSYTYVRSLFEDKNKDLIPTTWDSKHLVTITASQKFGKNWSAGLKWRFVGGLPYTPYDLDVSSIKSVWDAYGSPRLDVENLNSKRFANFHQLDLRIDKKFYFDKWSFGIYFDAQNAYNFQAEGQPIILREKTDDGSFALTDGGNRYNLRAIENTSGTVLPTLGLMVEF